MILQFLNVTGGEIVEKPTLEKPSVNVSKTKEKVEKTIITIEVLNGCGIDGAAGTLREYLIGKNFDVVDFKNYESFDVPQTLVIDRIDMEKTYAKKVAKAIGVSKDQIIPQKSPQRKLDVTVIIGKDYKKFEAFKQYP